MHSGSDAPGDVPVVIVADDDGSICRSLSRLLRAAGLEARSFASAQVLFDEELADRSRLNPRWQMQGVPAASG